MANDVHEAPYDVTVVLDDFLRAPSTGWILVNATRAATLARHVNAALDSRSRRRGLLGRTALDDEALIIAPCSAVHTFFMHFPIDVLFTDRQGRIGRLSAGLRPWRLAGGVRGFAAIELPAGTAARTGTRPGDRVELRLGQ
jgi:uncharacterized membrane protein (UPF0127 family)